MPGTVPDLNERLLAKRRETVPAHHIGAAHRSMGLDALDRGISVVRDRYGDILKLLMASVSLLVLIVCANVGGLLLARSAAPEQ